MTRTREWNDYAALVNARCTLKSFCEHLEVTVPNDKARLLLWKALVSAAETGISKKAMDAFLLELKLVKRDETDKGCT